MTLNYVTVTKEYLANLECKVAGMTEEMSSMQQEIANLRVVNENLRKKVQLACEKDYVISELRRTKKKFAGEISNLNHILKVRETNHQLEIKDLKGLLISKIEELNNIIKNKNNKILSLSNCQQFIEVLKVLKDELNDKLIDLEFKKETSYEYDDYVDKINTIKKSSESILNKTLQQFTEYFYKNIDNNAVKYFQALLGKMFNEVKKLSEICEDLFKNLYTKDKLIKNLKLELDLRHSINDLIIHQQNNLNELYRAIKNQSKDLTLKKLVLKDIKRGKSIKIKDNNMVIKPVDIINKEIKVGTKETSNINVKEKRECSSSHIEKKNNTQIKRSTSENFLINYETLNPKNAYNTLKSDSMDFRPKLNLEALNKMNTNDWNLSSNRKSEENLVTKPYTDKINFAKFSWYFSIIEQFFESIKNEDNIEEKLLLKDFEVNKLGKNTLIELGQFVKKLHSSINFKFLQKTISTISQTRSTDKTIRVKRRNILDDFCNYIDNKV